MASLDDISDILGQYMLKEWVLTDKSCQSCSTPLMRSPRAMSKEVWFCAKCDGGPPGSATRKANPQSTTAISPSTESSSAKSIDTAPSTPATEISEIEFVLPPETEEFRRRRQQSDQASAELGRRLLQGWAMLGEECPSSSCYGVPLMRPPNSGSQQSTKKECVICGGVYTTDQATGYLLPLNPPSSSDRTSVPSMSSIESIGQVPQIQERIPDQVITRRHESTQLGTLNLPDIALPHVLSETSKNLQSTLQGLSACLTTLTPLSFQNPEAISRTASAISEITQALRHVEQLRHDQAIRAQAIRH